MEALGGVYAHAELSKARGGDLEEHLKLAGETQESLISTAARQVSMQVTPV